MFVEVLVHNRQSVETKRLQSNEDVIRYFIDIDSIDALAFFYAVKSRYVNSTIYNYSPAKVAKEFELSPYLVQKYVRILRKEGLVRKMRKSLTMAGKQTLISKFALDVFYTDYGMVRIKLHKCSVFIEPEHSVKDIKLQLLSKMLELKIRQQEYARRKKADCVKTSQGQQGLCNERLFDYNVLSYRSISKIFKMPLSSCHKTVKKMKEKGFVQVSTIKYAIKVATPHAHDVSKEVLNSFYGYTFYNRYDRCIWAVPGSAIDFPYFNSKMKISSQPLPNFKSLSVTESLFT